MIDARDVVSWAIDEFPCERRVVVTSLQAAGVAVADMAVQVDSAVRVATIDTGRLPEQTLAYLDTLRERWGRPIEVVVPDPRDVQPFVLTHGVNPFYASTDLRLQCCNIRKVLPLQRLLADVDCWITGLQRDDSSDRAGVDVIEIDEAHGGIVKLNPLAEWSSDQVFAYLRSRGIPEHPLYGAGYTSIGCAPCTRAVQPGEDARAGRWWWERGTAKECGIHGGPLQVVAATDREEVLIGGRNR